MTSQVLADTQKLAEDVVTAIDAHAAALDAGASAKLASDLRHNERWPAVALLLQLAGRRVQRTLAAYAAAEAALDVERADDAEPRAERDAQALALYGQLKKVKGTVESLFGAPTVGKLQFPAALPRDPAVLAQAADNVVGALKKHKLPAPQVEGVGKVDAGVWIELLTTPLDKLKTARARVNLEDKELAAALATRDAAVEAASEAMVEALQLARAFARLADKGSLFDGLRATIEYRSAPADGAPPAAPATTTPPDR